MKNLDHIKSLAELLKVAVADLEMINKNPKYILDVDLWHHPIDSKKGDVCAVCIAGAVLAGTLEVNNHKCMDPYSFESKTCKLLLALDHLRTDYPDEAIAKRLSIALDRDISPDAIMLLRSCYDDDKLHFGDLREWSNLAHRAEELGL